MTTLGHVGDTTWNDDWATALTGAAHGIAPLSEERRGGRRHQVRSVAERLAASAVALFAQQGYDAVTVTDIAAEAGVTARTFYRYFPTKETVVVDIYDQTNVRLLSLVETARAERDGVLPALEEAAVQWFAEFGELFAALSRITDASTSLKAAVLSRTSKWEDYLAAALLKRFPALSDQQADVWAYTTMALLRLVQRTASISQLAFAEAARRVFAEFAAISCD